MNKQPFELRPGTIFFFHYAIWSPVGTLLVLTEPQQNNSRWGFRKLDEHKATTSLYVDDSKRRDITIVGQLPPDALDATVFRSEYYVGHETERPVKPAGNRLATLVKKYW